MFMAPSPILVFIKHGLVYDMIMIFISPSFGTENTVPYCHKYTPTDCFLGDFAHWPDRSRDSTNICI